MDCSPPGSSAHGILLFLIRSYSMGGLRRILAMASGGTLSKLPNFSKHCVLIKDSVKGVIVNIFLTCLCLIPSHFYESVVVFLE